MRIHAKFFSVIAVAAVAVLALVGCSSGASSSASATSATSATSGSSASSAANTSSAASSASSASASSDSSDVAVLDASDTVFISLDYSAGTGYQWVCTMEPEGVLEQTDKTTEDRSEPGMTGGTLRDTFTLRAQSPGEVVVTFNLVREWEKDQPPAETQVYAFTVTKYREINLDREKSDFKLDPEWITYS